MEPNTNLSPTLTFLMASKLPEDVLLQATQGNWDNVHVQLSEWVKSRSKVDVLKEVTKTQNLSFIQWFLTSTFAPKVTPSFYQAAVRRAMIHDSQAELTLLLEAMDTHRVRFTWKETPMASPVIFAIQHNHFATLDALFPLCEAMNPISVPKEQRHQYLPLFYAMQKMDKDVIEKIISFYDTQAIPLNLGELVGVAKTSAFEFLIASLAPERIEQEKLSIIEGVIKKGRWEQVEWLRQTFDLALPEMRGILLSSLSRKSEKAVIKFVEMLYVQNPTEEAFQDVVRTLATKEQTKTRGGLLYALDICEQHQWAIEEAWIQKVLTASFGPDFREEKRQALLNQYPGLVNEPLQNASYIRILDSDSVVYLKAWCELQPTQPECIFSILAQRKSLRPNSDFLLQALLIFKAQGWRVDLEKAEYQREILPYLLQGIAHPQVGQWVDKLAEMGLNLNGFQGKSEWSQHQIWPGGLIHSILRLQDSYQYRQLKPSRQAYVELLSREDVHYPGVEAMETLSVKHPELYELLSSFVHRRKMQAILPKTSSTPSKLRL